MGLLRPEYTDEKSGYRYYGIRQFECLNTIRYLRVLNTPLEEIRDFLDNRDIDKISKLLERQKQAVTKRQAELRSIEKRIDNRLRQIKDALGSELDVIHEVTAGERRLALLEAEISPQTYLDLEYSIRRLEKEEPVVFLGKVGVGISRKRLEAEEYGTYDMVFVVLEEEDCFKGETLTIPEQMCAVVRFQGTHRQAGKYYERMMAYFRSKGYQPGGFSREITIIDEGLTHDSSKFVTEIQIPIA